MTPKQVEEYFRSVKTEMLHSWIRELYETFEKRKHLNHDKDFTTLSIDTSLLPEFYAHVYKHLQSKPSLEKLICVPGLFDEE